MQDIIPPRRTQPSRLPVTRSEARPAAPRVRMSGDIAPAAKPKNVALAATKPKAPVRTPLTRPVEHLTAHGKNTARARANATARKKPFDWKQWALIALAVVLVCSTGYATYYAWQLNNKARTVETPASVEPSANGTFAAAQEGMDESEPPASALSQYQVAADLPRAIYINKINVAARILPMGINELGAIQAPVNIYDAGWYTGSVKPGEVGAMFMDAHASGATRAGLFAYLDKLVVGDEIEIEKGDGSRLTYRVVQTEVADLEGLDMQRMLLPKDGVTRGLNLMTCIGDWVEEKNTYDKRVLVWAEQI